MSRYEQKENDIGGLWWVVLRVIIRAAVVRFGAAVLRFCAAVVRNGAGVWRLGAGEAHQRAEAKIEQRHSRWALLAVF